VEPYSVVEIEYVAQQVGQGRQAVETKYVYDVLPFAHLELIKFSFFCRRLSQMILDKVFHGVLDQGRGCLLVFDEPEADVSSILFHEFVSVYRLHPL
jgi:26S proteasome regulatory subunit N6